MLFGVNNRGKVKLFFSPFNITSFLKLNLEVGIWRVYVFSCVATVAKVTAFELVCGDKGFKFTVYKQKGTQSSFY